ncbi:MAG: glycosyltransferase [Lachnospiraceae bacterium]|nr:glycosyltransferase [Lachnospiraceae bacterium]
MEQELISIIVPIYNAEEYLEDCLDSIVKQTYKNLEILLVENGSTDDSFKICQEYASRYSNIRLLKEGIRQQGSARNRALSEMTGVYYCFVDADDYVSESYVEKMYAAAKEYSADLVLCGVVNMLECRDVKKDVTNSVYPEKDPGKLRRSVWGKLYRSSIYDKVRFSNTRMGSDVIYSGEIYAISTNAAICGEALYAYRSYQTSVTRIVPNDKFFEKMDRFIEEKNTDEYQHLIQKCIQVVSQRHEEKLYHKQLAILKDKIDYAEKLSLTIDEKLYQKLLSMIDASHVSMIVYSYLKLKQLYTSCFAAYRRKINYHCHLD